MAPLLQFVAKQGTSRYFVFLLSILITLAFAWLLHEENSPMEGLEWRMYDSYHRIRGPVEHPGKVVIVTIGEDSLAKIGHWPWGRDVLGRMVDNLTDAGASIIMFDIIFPEKTATDAVFGAAMARSGRVILPLAFTFDRETYDPTDEDIERSAFLYINNQDVFEEYPPIMAPGILLPVEALSSTALSLGSVQVFPDEDGVLRWEPFVVGYDDFIYPSVALITSAQYLGVSIDEVLYDAGKQIHLDDDRTLLVDDYGRSLIYYYGGNKTFPYIRASDVIEGSFDPLEVKDKIVLIGATATGLYDLVVTPYSAGQPGVEKHANVISAILDKKSIERASNLENLLLLLIAGLIFSFSAALFQAKGIMISSLSLITVVMSGGYLMFDVLNIMVKTVHVSIMLGVSLMLTMAMKYLVEEHRAGNIKALFSNYVTSRVVNELIRNPELAKLGGHRKKVTILFSDIRGFTSFSEVHSPEAVVTHLNEYLGEMTDCVFKYEGTLDKYIGDAVMVFWGAPLDQSDQARRAVECGLEMLERLDRLNEKWKIEDKPSFKIGIGINTGEVLVGNIGATGKKMEYTVIGDSVNLASRCEALNKTYNTSLLITEFTLDDLNKDTGNRDYSLKDLGNVTVKGKEKAVRIFSAFRKRDDEYDTEG